MKALTIKDIILEKIAATGADGLCSVDNQCWCAKDRIGCYCYGERLLNCHLVKELEPAETEEGTE